MERAAEILAQLAKLNKDIDDLVTAGEKIGDTLFNLVSEVEKLITTEAEVNTITIHEEE